MKKLTRAEWEALPASFRGTWTTERPDWPDWDNIREQYMGKRTMMSARGLEIEGVSFLIVDDEPTQAAAN